jgi:hypothetical protein
MVIQIKHTKDLEIRKVEKRVENDENINQY